MSHETFDDLESRMTKQGIDAVFDKLVEQLKADKKYHELFDVLLMRTRHRLGLPVILTMSLDDLAEPLRTQVEEAYLAACREVGTLLLAEGQWREAWMYLRPVGEKALVADALRKAEPNDDNLQDLIEIGLHEGVAPAYGYELVLKNYGTCNAITTFESALSNRPRSEQQAAAALLLNHLYRELVANVRSDIARQEGNEPKETTLKQLVADRDWLFLENNYHIDTTHLAAVVRFARLLEDRELLALALDLTEYGRHLGSQFQFAGDEPFTDVYRHHGLFFAAQLGQQVDEALAYFHERAKSLSIDEYGSGACEIYIGLLARLGRYAEAIDATIELLPAGTRTSGFAPSLLELSRMAGNYDRLMAACRERGDLVAYTAGLVERTLRA